jgi:hypothetical protein|tara:strand:- start:180 stop:359 length:180 start_codon:yes stop_codon:yes gene_type:complete
MSVKDLINQAFSKDADAFEQTFESVMVEKMTSAIEAKYDAMFGSDEDDEDEEDDEEDDS